MRLVKPQYKEMTDMLFNNTLLGPNKIYKSKNKYAYEIEKKSTKNIILMNLKRYLKKLELN